MKRRLASMASVLAFVSVSMISGAADAQAPGWGYGMGPGMMGPGMMGPGMMGGYGPGQGGGYGPGYGMGPGMMGPGMMGPGMMGGYGPGQGGGYGPGYGMGPGMMAGYGMMGPGPWGNLTNEQRNSIAKIQEETRKKQWDLMGRMREEQYKLQELYYSDKADANAINNQYKKVDELRQQMMSSAIDAQKRIEGALPKEQREIYRRWGPGGWMMWGY